VVRLILAVVVGLAIAVGTAFAVPTMLSSTVNGTPTPASSSLYQYGSR
jgi:Protein of unknown function (DUF2613)